MGPPVGVLSRESFRIVSVAIPEEALEESRRRADQDRDDRRRPPRRLDPVDPVPTTAADVAVVRLPIADAKGAVVGYELVFADAAAGSSPAFNARATAGMLAGAYADIDLDRLTGSHLAWLSVARNFLVEVGMPPVRPDRAVIQVAAYPAKDDLMEVLDRLTSVGFTLALTDYDGTEQLDELLQLCSIVKAPLGGMDPGRRVELVDELNAVGAQIVATGVDDEAA